MVRALCAAFHLRLVHVHRDDDDSDDDEGGAGDKKKDKKKKKKPGDKKDAKAAKTSKALAAIKVCPCDSLSERRNDTVLDALG
jgi:hypothetical protein